MQCTSAAATIDEQLVSVEGGDTNEAVVASAMPIVDPRYPTQDRDDLRLSSVQPSSSLVSGIGEDDTGARIFPQYPNFNYVYDTQNINRKA